MQKLNTFKFDIIAVGILLIAGLKLTLGLENVMDVGLYDESYYLYAGVKLLDQGLPSAEWAPLYAAWYYLLSLFQPNRIELYYLNYKILSILLPILFYVFLRRCDLSAVISVIASVFVLISYANLPVWPKPAHFSALIALVFFILATYIPSFTSATLFVSIGALLSSFVRPDFFLAYLLLLVLYVGVLVATFRQLRLSREISAFLAFATVSSLLLVILGQPAFGVQGSRSFEAFGQHFSLNWVRWTDAGLNPWTNWTEIVSNNFGDAHSILEALANNPPLFFKHVVSNVLGLVKFFAILLLIPYNIILPINLKILWVVEGCLFFGILAAYAVYFRHTWLPKLRDNFQCHKRLLLYATLYSMPGFLSALVIFPRSHYLLLSGILVVAMITIFVIKDTVKEGDGEYKRLLFTGFLLIALTPLISTCYPTDISDMSGKRENVETIEFINSLGIEEEVNLLDAEGGFHIYLGDNFHRVAEYEKDTKCNDFLSERGINMIVLSNTLKGDTRFINDEECLVFWENYSAFGFERMSIPNTDRELFVKKDMLTD
jgi:hypothetical protein